MKSSRQEGIGRSRQRPRQRLIPEATEMLANAGAAYVVEDDTYWQRLGLLLAGSSVPQWLLVTIFCRIYMKIRYKD